MDFADADAVLLKSSDRLSRLLKFHRKMASVVIHAEVLRQSRISRPVGVQLLEELDSLRAGFQIAQRLRFETEMKFFSSAFAQSRDVFDAAPEICANLRHLFGRANELLE